MVVQGLLSDEEAEDLEQVLHLVADRLNTIPRQSDRRFVFRTYPNARLLRGVKPGGERGREYNNDLYWEVLKVTRTAARVPHLIGVCGQPLAETSFNFENRDEQLGIVSVQPYDVGLVPAGMTLERYIMYLVICVAILLTNRDVVEHEIPGGCLFSECKRVEQIIPCLRKPSLDHCRVKQLAHIHDDEIRGYRALLNDIGRIDPLTWLSSTFGTRIVGLVGGVVLAFVTNVITGEWPRVGVVAACLGVLVAGYLLLMRPLNAQTWARRHRGLAFRLTTAIALALAAVTIYIVGFRQVPELPSDTPTPTPATTPATVSP